MAGDKDDDIVALLVFRIPNKPGAGHGVGEIPECMCWRYCRADLMSAH